MCSDGWDMKNLNYSIVMMKSLKGHEYKFKLLYTVYYEDVFTIIIYIQIVIYKYISRQDYGLHFQHEKGKTI